jgi:uncharacterized protein (DUF2267 family)
MNLDSNTPDQRFHDLVDRIRAEADLSDPDRAAVALEAVLFCLTRRLAGDEVAELTARLPDALRERFPEEPEADRSVDRKYVEEELARRLDVDHEAARAIAAGVTRALAASQTATPAMLRELKSIA